MDGVPVDRYIDATAQELGAQFDTATANALRMLQQDLFLFWMWAVGILLGAIGTATGIILAAVT